jgi:formate-dependent phosphoribosylglycinamide formyltransferase (GAR transformylase)
VLVATTCRWLSTARLTVALTNAGCTVEAVCPPRHPVRKTSVLHRAHTYHGLAPLASFADAIAETKPDLIIPSDDLATRHLHDLYYRAQRDGEKGTQLRALIERSLGAPTSFPITYGRTAFMELAREEGIRVPKTAVIANLGDLRKWMDTAGLPMVLKANGTSGGEGVRIVHTVEEAERAFRRLQAPPILLRVAKWVIVDQDMTLVWPALTRRRSVVNAQTFVPGREATSLIACWNGTVLGSHHFEVLGKQESSGPATVMRLVDNPEMAAAAEKMARRLNLSGLHGFDFMLEKETGNAYLIEINARATQIGHLALGPGRDLPAALYAAVTGNMVQPAPKLTEKDTIALFPQEWLRNPKSPFLKSGYHDVPWDEPELVRTCIRKSRKWTIWKPHQKWMQVFSGDHLPRL